MSRDVLFEQQCYHYKQLINADIDIYSAHVRAITNKQYGPYPALVTDAFLDMVGRGGKRMRGMLALVGYAMCGGTDQQMIVRAATALEMVHAHLLILDDIQDRSTVRRGKPAVHEMLSTYHQKHHLTGDAAHTGVSLALNAVIAGQQAAYMLLAGLSVAAELKIKALGILNQAVLVTAHGQTQDIMQEVTGKASRDDIYHTMEWKTAYYSVLNPLCVGMVLAGAGCEDTDAIRDYALHTGMAFQISDDIMGVFGTQEQMGKSPMDDIREGKQTLLVAHALEKAAPEAAAVLRRCLGKTDLSAPEFAHCKRIIIDSGALSHAKDKAREHIAAAVTAIAHTPSGWDTEQVLFLRTLAQSLENRST